MVAFSRMQRLRTRIFSARPRLHFPVKKVILLVKSLMFVFMLVIYYYFGHYRNSTEVESPRKVNQLTNNIVNWSANQDERIDDRRIFFHETSGRHYITARQSCAIESAAKYNPDRKVHLYLQTDRLSDGGRRSIQSALLDHYENVVVFLLGGVEEEYFASTPLRHWYEAGLWRSSPFRSGHLSDYIRFVSAWRGGGLYMDIDFITMRPLKPENTFRNFFSVLESAHAFLANGIFQLDRNNLLLEAIMEELAGIKYEPTNWARQGPLLLSNFMRELCDMHLPSFEISKLCNVTILPHSYFFPVDYKQWQIYFEEVDDNKPDDKSRLMSRLEASHAVHVWNHLSCLNKTDLIQKMNRPRRKTVYDLLTAKHCPLTYAKSQQSNELRSRDKKAIDVDSEIFDLHFQVCDY